MVDLAKQEVLEAAYGGEEKGWDWRQVLGCCLEDA